MPSGRAHHVPRTITGKLNTVNDAVAGGAVAQVGGEALFGGEIGNRVILDQADALRYSDTSVGTLYGGEYQLVRTKAGSTAAPARGRIAYWDDLGNYVVTPDAPTAQSEIAGVYVSAPTKGNYCIIQRAGLAGVLFGTVTKATPAIGDLVIGAAGVADVLADATSLTSVEARKILGTAWEAPVSDTVKLVMLRTLFLNI